MAPSTRHPGFNSRHNVRSVAETRSQSYRSEQYSPSTRYVTSNSDSRANPNGIGSAIAGRAKCEDSVSGLCAQTANLRLSQLEQDVRVAGAALPPRSTAGLFKSVCSTDLLFLIDTTSSMGPYIEAAKEQVMTIVNDVKVASLDQAEVRIAVVGYKDHSDVPNIQFLDFTLSVDRVYWFLEELTPTGGADEPEDVLGGIQQALNASWKQQTRCIIHIADAPPHGYTLHDYYDGYDDYFIPGSEPHGLTHKPLLKKLIGLGINYALLRINDSTDLMALEFFQVYHTANANCKLHTINAFYDEACDMDRNRASGFGGWGNSKRSAKAGLLFEEVELGTTFSALRHLVFAIVSASVTCTAARVLGAREKKMGTSMAPIVEQDEDEVEDRLETIPPRWDRIGWFDETLTMEGYSPDVMALGANTLNDMMRNNDNIKITVTELTIYKRSQPFAEGAMRLAFYARTAASINRFVVKKYKQDGKWIAHMFEDMRCQALCKAFALEFNALLGSRYPIDFIVTTCLRGKAGECLSLEPFLQGKYVKYNSNCGYVSNDHCADECNQAAQAFSHFTFERSKGLFLVSDLQGTGYVLTDPAIQTRDPIRFKLTGTNFGEEGFKFFFSTHECNHICGKLKLMSDASMITSRKYIFRNHWPKMDDAVCCSNKLCGRIVRFTQAKESSNYPGFHWCDTCWPQLNSSMVMCLCVAPGPTHKFQASSFFHESQGRQLPRRCRKHRN